MAIVAMIGSTIASTVAAVLAYLKSKEAVVKGDQNHDAIKDLHVIVNDRLTQLLATNKALSRAEGREEGVAAELQRGSGEAARLAVALQTPPPVGTTSALADNTRATEANTAAVAAETTGR